MLDAGSDYAPHHELIVFVYADGLVVAVGRDEPGAMIGFIEFELLQGELSIDEGGHIIAAMGFERLVYHNQIAVIDSYILHGISGYLGIESGLGVLDEGLVQVDGFGQIVLGRTGKACLDAAVYIGKVQFRCEVGGLDM